MQCESIGRVGAVEPGFCSNNHCLHVESQGEGGIHKSEELSPKPSHPGALISDFQPPQLQEKAISVVEATQCAVFCYENSGCLIQGFYCRVGTCSSRACCRSAGDCGC